MRDSLDSEFDVNQRRSLHRRVQALLVREDDNHEKSDAYNWRNLDLLHDCCVVDKTTEKIPRR